VSKIGAYQEFALAAIKKNQADLLITIKEKESLDKAMEDRLSVFFKDNVKAFLSSN
jgi:hypothetical protein